MKRARCGELRIPKVVYDGDIELGIVRREALAYSVEVDDYSSYMNVICQPQQIVRCSLT